MGGGGGGGSGVRVGGRSLSPRFVPALKKILLLLSEFYGMHDKSYMSTAEMVSIDIK